MSVIAFRIVAALSLAAELSGTVSAVAADLSAEVAPLDEIIVTAQKRAENIQTVPISIGVVDGDTIERALITNVSGIADRVPGFVDSSDIPGQSIGVYNIRGIENNDPTVGASPAVPVVKDGVYNGQLQTTNVGMFDIGRVEVAKGPQGTLFGRNTIGGAISIETRRPGAEDGGYGHAFVTDDGGWRQEGAINLELAPTVAVRFAGQYTDEKGYVNNPTFGEKVGYLDSHGERASLLWHATDRWSLTVIADSNRAFSNGPAAQNKDNIPGFYTAGPPYSYVQQTNYLGTIGYKLDSGIAEVNGDLGWASLTSLTSIQVASGLVNYDVDFTPINAVGSATLNDTHQVSEELRLTSPGNQRFDWFVGTSFYREKIDESLSIIFGGGLFNVLGIPSIPPTLQSTQTRATKQTTDSGALYAEGTFHLTDTFRVTAGVRYTRDQVDQTVNTNTPVPELIESYTPTNGPVRRTGTFDGTSPRVALSYDIAPKVMAYASYTEGWKTGGFNPGIPTEEAMQPQTAKSYEIGLRSAWLDNHLVANMSVYDYRYYNLVTRVPVNGVLTIEPASFTGRGVELDLTYRPIPGLTLTATGAGQRAHYTNFISAGVQEAGKDVVDTPRYTAYASAEYEFKVVGEWTTGVRAEYLYRSDINTQPTNDPAYAVPGYGLTNVRVWLRTPNQKYELAVFGKNIFNRQYISNVTELLPPYFVTEARGRGDLWGIEFSGRY